MWGFLVGYVGNRRLMRQHGRLVYHARTATANTARMTGAVLCYLDFNHHNGNVAFCTRSVQRDRDKWRVWGVYTSEELKDDCPNNTPNKAGERWDATFEPTSIDNVFTCRFEDKEPVGSHDIFHVQYCKETQNFLFKNVTSRGKPDNVWYYAGNMGCASLC